MGAMGTGHKGSISGGWEWGTRAQAVMGGERVTTVSAENKSRVQPQVPVSLGSFQIPHSFVSVASVSHNSVDLVSCV